MISPDYIDSSLTVALYYDKRTSHYHLQPKFKILDFSEYTLSAGETLYTVAEKIFGSSESHYWSIIADMNPHKRAEEWEPGDTILVPTIIVRRRNTVLDNEL